MEFIVVLLVLHVFKPESDTGVTTERESSTCQRTKRSAGLADALITCLVFVWGTENEAEHV